MQQVLAIVAVWVLLLAEELAKVLGFKFGSNGTEDDRKCVPWCDDAVLLNSSF